MLNISQFHRQNTETSYFKNHAKVWRKSSNLSTDRVCDGAFWASFEMSFDRFTQLSNRHSIWTFWSFNYNALSSTYILTCIHSCAFFFVLNVCFLDVAIDKQINMFMSLCTWNGVQLMFVPHMQISRSILCWSLIWSVPHWLQTLRIQMYAFNFIVAAFDTDGWPNEELNCQNDRQ